MRRFTLYSTLSVEECRQRLEAVTEPPPSWVETIAGGIWVPRNIEKRFRGRWIGDSFEITAKRQSTDSMSGSVKIKGFLEPAGKGTTIVCDLDDGFVMRLCAFIGLLILVCAIPAMHDGLIPSSPMLSLLASLGIYGGGAFAGLFVFSPMITRTEIGVMTNSLQEVLDASSLITES